MSLTSENILNSVDVILHQEEKKEAENRLEELKNKVTNQLGPDRLESELDYYVKAMPEQIIRIFLDNKLEPMTRETVFKNLKNDTSSFPCNWQGWHRYFGDYQSENGKMQYRLETVFDDILRVLVENNYIQYNCYSTVCHYIYRGKK